MKKGLMRTAIVAGVLLVIITVVVLAAWSITGFSSAAAAANQQYRDWQANGLPVRQDQLYLAPAPAESDNALKDLKEAIGLIKSMGKDAKIQTKLYEPQAFASGETAAYLKRVQPIIDATHRLASKPTLRFARDLDAGFAVDFSEFASMKELAKILSLDAEYKASKGNYKAVARDIYSIRRLAALSAQDANLISGLVGIALDAIALGDLSRFAPQFADNAAALAAFRKAVEDSKWEVDHDQMFRGEAYISFATFRNLSDNEIISYLTKKPDWIGENAPKKRALVRDGQAPNIMARAVTAEMMAYWNEFYPRLTDPKEDMKKVSADMDSWAAAYESSSSKPKQVAALTLPVFSQAMTAFDRQRSDHRTAIAFLGILQYRQARGSWPATLKAAGVEAIDLIDGKPIRYKIQGSSARVWNVGRNGVDDGGVAPWEASKLGLSASQTDNVYVHPRPARP